MTPGSTTQGVAPSYNAQSYTSTDIYRDQPAVRTGPGYGNDAYGGGSISQAGYGFNHAMAASGSWGTPAPQPLQNSDYSMPSTIPNSNLRQAGPYYAGYNFGTEQVPAPTMSFSPHLPHLPEADPNRDASSGWRFRTCWVSHSGEDEIHLTIALKKS
ncbi:hypothetical protein F5888DRAFT_1660221 [Russula emetica]|nr:hypothetical protein F5888DRAFT_1660221 [Russula emetica]